jgi:glycopeptide antibiotics resistance protein
VPSGARLVLSLLFGVYLALLAWTVLWKLHVPFVGRDDMREIKLVPFVPADGFGSSASFEVAMNVLIFVPFGVYLALLVPAVAVWRVAGLSAAASLALEAAQFVLASGSSDLTDVIVNTAGGVVGWSLLALARRRLGARTAAVAVRWCLVGTFVLVAAAGLHIASFPRLPAPGEGVVVIQ